MRERECARALRVAERAVPRAHAFTLSPSLSLSLSLSSPLHPQYRPTRLDRLVLHKDLGSSLQKLVKEREGVWRGVWRNPRPASVSLTLSPSSQVAAGDLPHTLFYGPAGAGKTTLMKATLRELYGPGVERVKVETTPWKVQLPSRSVDVELTTLASNYHVELTPADAGNMDR